MLGNFLECAALIVVMIIATGVAINQFEKLAVDLRVRKLLLASLLVGLSTSLPELFIALASSFDGTPQVALGDLMGANIANLSWVIGGAAIVGRVIPVVGDYLREDLWVTMVLALTPFLLMMDGSLSRLDGVVLIFGYLLYVNDLIHKGRFKIKQAKLNKHVETRVYGHSERLVHLVKMIVSLVILGVSAGMLVQVSISIANGLGASTFWVGLIVIAFGTTVPELVVSLEAARRREASLILGNLLGSVVVNSSLIMGLAAIISPMIFVETLQKGVASFFLIIILGVFWLFTRTKHRLDRWEGAVLVGVYLMFVGLQLLILR